MNSALAQKLFAKPQPGAPSSAPKDETPPIVDYGSLGNLSRDSSENPAKHEAMAALEVKMIERELEEYIKNRGLAFEEKLFEQFYYMRIEQSRKFIELVKKINKSWEDFVEYLKVIGSQGPFGDGDGTNYTVTNTNSFVSRKSDYD